MLLVHTVLATSCAVVCRGLPTAPEATPSNAQSALIMSLVTEPPLEDGIEDDVKPPRWAERTRNNGSARHNSTTRLCRFKLCGGQTTRGKKIGGCVTGRALIILCILRLATRTDGHDSKAWRARGHCVVTSTWFSQHSSFTRSVSWARRR
jgi:hypothetical protein